MHAALYIWEMIQKHFHLYEEVTAIQWREENKFKL